MSTYTALHDYAATEADEVALQEGDTITNVSPVEGSAGNETY